MSECLFCRIIAKEIPAEIIYEDAYVLGFLDAHPHAPGHTLIIPKRHIPALIDLPDEEIGPFFTAAKKIDSFLTTGLNADGLTLGINQGEAGGQAVEHFHLHLLPRFHGDGGSSIHGVVNNPPKETLEDLGRRLRLALQRE